MPTTRAQNQGPPGKCLSKQFFLKPEHQPQYLYIIHKLISLPHTQVYGYKMHLMYRHTQNIQPRNGRNLQPQHERLSWKSSPEWLKIIVTTESLRNPITGRRELGNKQTTQTHASLPALREREMQGRDQCARVNNEHVGHAERARRRCSLYSNNWNIEQEEESFTSTFLIRSRDRKETKRVKMGVYLFQFTMKNLTPKRGSGRRDSKPIKLR